MKSYFVVALVCLIVISCQKKTFNEDSHDYLTTVKNELSISLIKEDFNSLDFSRAVLSKVDSAGLYFLQIPLNSESMVHEFVLVKTNVKGHIEKGKIISLNKVESTTEAIVSPPWFDGFITIHSLTRSIVLSSSIRKGFIESLHIQDSTVRAEYVTPDPYIELPEVVIVSSYSSSGGVSWSTWYSVMDMVGSGYSSGGGWYASDGGNYSGGGGGGTGSSPSSTPAPVQTEPLIHIRPETEVNSPAISLINFINCFNSIPDAGAECKITIHTDLPVNGDPTKLFNFNSGSPGHTWLRFEKSNGSQHASQHVGFYPASDWKTLVTTSPITGKFVDNGNHEFNASYEVSITPAQLKAGLTRMYLNRSVRYDVEDYNCTDWALDVFNQSVSPANFLTIPQLYIPGGTKPDGSNTPQGLFVKLRDMYEDRTDPGVSLPIVGYSGASSGACKPALVE